MRARWIAIACSFGLGATLAAAACKTEDDCDSGYVKQDNICLPATAPDASPEAAPPDAGPEAEAEADAGPFGRPCTHGGADSGDCEPPAPYCAIQPGTSTGYCTAVDCKANPSVCPPNWTCFSVPGLDFCLKP